MPPRLPCSGVAHVFLQDWAVQTISDGLPEEPETRQEPASQETKLRTSPILPAVKLQPGVVQPWPQWSHKLWFFEEETPA